VSNALFARISRALSRDIAAEIENISSSNLQMKNIGNPRQRFHESTTPLLGAARYTNQQAMSKFRVKKLSTSYPHFHENLKMNEI
jgi:hypothetical protein